MSATSLSSYITDHPLRILIIWFFLVSGLKAVISSFILAPQSLSDEMLYDLIARMIAQGEIFFGTSSYLSSYPPGYPAVLSISHLFFSDRSLIYHIELIINAFLSSMLIFPSFFLLKRYCSVIVSLAGALTIPVCSVILAPSFLLMSENLFTLVFLLACWGLCSTLSRDEPGFIDILTGLLIIFAVAVRPVGFALVAGLILTLFYHAWHNPGSFFAFRKKILYFLSPIILICMAWGFDQVFLHKLPGLHPAVGLSPGVSPVIIEHVGTFMYTTLLGGLYLVFTPYLFLTFVSIWFVWAVFFREKKYFLHEEENESHHLVRRSVLVFIIVSSFIQFAFAMVFTFGFIRNDIPHIYGRYLDPIIPFIILFAFAGTELLITKSKEEKRFFLKYLGIFIIIITLVGAVSFLPSLPVQNNNAGLFYLYSLSSTFHPLVLLLPILLSAGYCYLIIKQVPASRVYWFIFFCCLLTAIPIINWQIHQSQNYGEIHRAFDTMQAGLGDDAVYVWDLAGNTGRYDPVYRDSIKFWIGDRLVDSRAGVITTGTGEKAVVIENLMKGDYLISRADYPLQKGTRMDEFWFYPILSLS